MGLNLFQIGLELDDIWLELEENGGELTEELAARLAISEQNFTDKIGQYSKAYRAYNADVESCKNEKTRIEGILKTRKNRADRLKSTMLEAVLRYGNTGKSGNKVVEMADGKVYTSSSSAVEINDERISTFQAYVIAYLRELYDNGMTDPNDDAMNSFDVEAVLEIINKQFEAECPNMAEAMMTELGHLFTTNDMSALKFNVSFEVSADQLFAKSNFDVANTMFNHEHEYANVTLATSKSDVKAFEKILGSLSYAKTVKNTNLIIK